MANKFKEFFTRPFSKKESPTISDPELNNTADAFYRVPGAGGYSGGSGLSFNRWTLQSYDGEKNFGSAGPITERIPDSQALRIRGHEAYLTNETVQAVVNKCVKWIVGRGLQLQSIISVDVLSSEGIKVTKEQVQAISDLTEARFGIYADSEMSSYSGMKCLNLDEGTCYKNVYNGGDILVILRYVNGQVKYELVDGQHVKSPQGGTDFSPQILDGGNRIMNGVEMDDKGTHIAYHLQDASLEWKRVLCRNKTTGLLVAYLVGGLEYRLDYSRTLPLFSGLFEIVKSLDRYTSATLQSAEEQNKNAFQTESEINSVGQSPFQQNVSKSVNLGPRTGDIPVDLNKKQMSDIVISTTNKQLIHNTPGTKITPINKNEAELYFKDFRGEFFEMICAAVNAPPNVIRGKYDTSFSSARASIKDWEHTLLVDRYKFSWQFRKPIYEFWLHMEVLNNKVSLPGYLNAHAKGNDMILASYRKAEWIGDNVPHIDPLKEVMAERLKLGTTGDAINLTTAESATRNVNGGDQRHNLQQYSRELKDSKAAGVEVPVMAPVTGNEKKASFESLFNYAFNNDVTN